MTQRCLIFLCLTAACGRAGVVPGILLPLHEVKVGTPVEGLVAEVFVREGDTVEKDAPLARLVDDLEKLDLERAEKTLEKARFDHEAAQRLLKENIGTREEALKKSIEHDLARIQRDAAAFRLQQKTLRAPIQGIVVTRGKEPGEAVLLHETVLQLVHVRQVEAQFFVEPAQAAALKTGQRMTVRLTAPGSELEAEVAFLDPRLDAESGLARVKLRLDNAALQLKAGMRVEAVFPDPAPGHDSAKP